MAPKSRRSILAFVSLMLFWRCSSLAAVKPTVDLPALCTSADVIVVGRVDTVAATDEKCRRSRFGREYEFGLWQATLTVERVIKGEFHDKKAAVDFPGPEKGKEGAMGILGAFEYLGLGELVVVFLRDNGQHAGPYAFANDYKSVIRIFDSPAVTRLLEGQSLVGKTEQQIASLLTASLDVCSAGMVEQAFSDLADLEGRQASVAISGVLDHCKDPAIRGEALATLVGLGDYSRLPEGLAFLQSGGETNRAVLNAKVNLSAQMSLVTNAEVVAKYYIPLLRHPSEFIRRDAVYAVRKAKTRSAVPQLIKGLQDSDQDIRYQCLMGLAEVLGRTGEWAPSKEVFEQNERDYIGRWQTWWDSGGRHDFKDMPH